MYIFNYISQSQVNKIIVNQLQTNTAQLNLMFNTKSEIPLVYVLNYLEDISKTFHTYDQKRKQQVEKEYAQCYYENQIISILCQYPNRQKYYFVFHEQANENYLQYICDLLNVERSKIIVLAPKKKQKCLGSVSTYLMEDKQLTSQLNSLPSFQLLSFCMSEEFLKLCDFFKIKGKPLQSVKRQNWQKIERFGTKSGLRQFIQKINDPQIVMPSGIILHNKYQSKEKQIIFQIKQQLKTKNIVVKTERHFSGGGVQIIEKKQVEGLNQLMVEQFIKQKLKDKFWWSFDLVIEEFIELDEKTGPPFIQFYIDQNGKVSILWWPSMFILNGRIYQGIQFGYQIFNQQIYKKMAYICQKIGSYLAQIGYRGYADIDFLIDRNGTIFVDQCNVRRSAPIYIHNFAKAMFGKQYFQQYFVMSQWVDSQKMVGVAFKDVISKLKEAELLYTKEKGEGIIVTSSQGTFDYKMLIYFTITKKKQKAMQIRQKVRQMYE